MSIKAEHISIAIRATWNFRKGTVMKVFLEEDAFAPTRAHQTDAGLDLRSRDGDFWLFPGQSYVFDTGVHIRLPKGTFGKIESKSGLNVNASVVSCGGVIDEGYIGSITVKLYNLGHESYHFKYGDKIAQLVIQPYLAPVLEEVDDLWKLGETDRGENGFGSSGR